MKSIRLRGRIHEDILLTALVRRNRYGITRWGVSLNTGILFGALIAMNRQPACKRAQRLREIAQEVCAVINDFDLCNAFITVCSGVKGR